LKLRLALMAVLLGSLGAQQCLGALISYTAAVGPPNVFNRPITNGSNPPVTTSDDDHYYHVFGFTVDVAETYRMEVVGTDGNIDSFLILYQGAFDPSNPLTNALEADDDGGVSFFSRIDRSLSTGTDYFLVTSTFDPETSVNYTVEIEGPTGNIISGIPEPATSVGLLTGLLGIGGLGFWRRRRDSRG